LDQSIMRVDPDVVAQRAASLPWVAGARVRLELPDKVIIDLTERSPVAVWERSDGQVLVDAGGTVMLAGNIADLPHVQTTGELPAVGAQLDPLDVAAVVAIDQALATTLGTLTMSDAEDFTATLTDSRVIAFGDAQHMPAKLAALGALAERTDLDWTFLDLSEPDRPYFR
jgi:cell division protein FtsQ